MSQSERSASVTGLPRPGPSPASVAPAPSESASGKANAKALAIDMRRLPFAIDGPARDDVHVAHGERRDRNVDPRRAALGEHLLAGGLAIAGFVPRAALQ